MSALLALLWHLLCAVCCVLCDGETEMLREDSDSSCAAAHELRQSTEVSVSESVSL